MEYLLNYLKGIALGAGAILPGISSGVLCVIFGIYEKLINSILGIFKEFKKNFLFLFPIFLGVCTGVILFGNLLNYLFESFPMQTKFSFIGLILGSIPVLFKKANNNKGFRLHYIIYLLFAFAVGIIMVIMENAITSSFIINENFSFTFLIIAGFCMSIGVVIPGVSSSVILMTLGVYYTYLEAVSTLNLIILIPMGIGLVLGGIVFLFLIQYLLENYYTQTFYGIIGFVLGSVLVLSPSFSFNFEGIVSLILFGISFYIALLFERV